MNCKGKQDEYVYYKRWDLDLLQGLGVGAGHYLLARMAFERRCLGRTNAVSGAAGLSGHRA